MTKKTVSPKTPAWQGSSSRAVPKRCFEGHPALPIGKFEIYGGSCSAPAVKDADIYVGFDFSMSKSIKSFPWESGESFLFHITDMQAPADPEQFKKLIEWLALQLTAQKKVHLGCIGGHGRTGTVLAALVTHMTGELDSITYVRKHYCERAVESKAQVDFLNKHFGITIVDGHKQSSGTSTGRWSSASSTSLADSPKVVPMPKRAIPVGTKEVMPTQHPLSLWGSDVTFDKLDKPGIIAPVLSTEGNHGSRS